MPDQEAASYRMTLILLNVGSADPSRPPLFDDPTDWSGAQGPGGPLRYGLLLPSKTSPHRGGVFCTVVYPIFR